METFVGLALPLCPLLLGLSAYLVVLSDRDIRRAGKRVDRRSAP